MYMVCCIVSNVHGMMKINIFGERWTGQFKTHFSNSMQLVLLFIWVVWPRKMYIESLRHEVET
jgi:hypothetical protein